MRPGRSFLVALLIVAPLVVAAFPTVRDSVQAARRDSSHRYPKNVVDTFVKDCSSGDLPAQHCGCVIDKLQARFTYGEFTALPPAQAADATREASLDCAGRDSHFYPQFMVQRFLTQCGGGTRQAYCQCVIDGLQAKYTVAEYARIEQQMAQPRANIPEYYEIADQCASQRPLPPSGEAPGG